MRVYLRQPCLAAVLLLSYILGLSSASPLQAFDEEFDDIDLSYNSTDVETDIDFPGEKRQSEDKFELRILPLGASIMSGMGSEHKDGRVHFYPSDV